MSRSYENALDISTIVDADRYADIMRATGFIDVQIVDKVKADELIGRQGGMPRLYSVRITARTP